MEAATREFTSKGEECHATVGKIPSEESICHATIIFVLGGPGSGKGTQCPEIAKYFEFTHLCAGDLLQKEVDTGSLDGKMIQKFKREGKLVPSELIVRFLQNAMEESINKKFLIDGFPRNEENRAAFENIVKIDPEFVIFLDCPEEVLIERVLNRNQGRIDDNIETLKKRLKVFKESTLPVIDYYSSKDKVHRIDASKPMEEVFDLLKSLFSNLS